MERYTLGELQAMPTLSVGQFADLKIEKESTRTWLSRMTVEDGAPYNHQVAVEQLKEGHWVKILEYPALHRTYQEYQGWINHATWSLLLIWRNSQDSSLAVEHVVQGKSLLYAADLLRAFVVRNEDAYLKTGRFLFEAARLHLRDVLSYQVGMCNWVRIHNALSGKGNGGPGEWTEIEQVVLEGITQLDWRAVIKDHKHLVDQDDALRDWFDEMLSRWLDGRPISRYVTSPLGDIARLFLEEDRNATNWQEAAESLLPENL